MIKRNRLKPVRPSEPILPVQPEKQVQPKQEVASRGRNVHNKKGSDSPDAAEGAST